MNIDNKFDKEFLNHINIYRHYEDLQCLYNTQSRHITLESLLSNENILFYEYHLMKKTCESYYNNNNTPISIIIRELLQINSAFTKTVVDLGCGFAHISKYFENDYRYTFRNYDILALNDDNIITGDIAHTEELDNSTHIVILCNAMWGDVSDCEDYIQEAHRILESYGLLLIIELSSKWPYNVLHNLLSPYFTIISCHTTNFHFIKCIKI